jgi:hypothetical protein
VARKRKSTDSYALCIRNDGFPASLEVRKSYRIIPDEVGGAGGLIRVIDESGEDYMYAAKWFIGVDPAAPVRRALSTAT